MEMQILHEPVDRAVMQDLSTPISNCRHCRFYQPEGRRGGQCQQLNVTVHGSWQACALVASPFEADAGDQVDVMAMDVATTTKGGATVDEATVGEVTVGEVTVAVSAR